MERKPTAAELIAELVEREAGRRRLAAAEGAVEVVKLYGFPSDSSTASDRWFPDVEKAPPEAASQRETFESARELPEAEQARRHKEADCSRRRAALKRRAFRFVDGVLREYPGATQAELLDVVRVVFPARRGPSTASKMPLEDRRLLRRTVTALLRENKAMGRRGAYETLAEKLNRSPEGIRALLR